MNLHWTTIYNLHCYIEGLEIVLREIQCESERALRQSEDLNYATKGKIHRVDRLCERAGGHLSKLRKLQEYVEELNHDDD